MSNRFALALVAAALAGSPALVAAQAPPQDQGHHDHGDRSGGDRGNQPGQGQGQPGGGRGGPGNYGGHGPDRPDNGRWGPNAPGAQGGYAGRGADHPGGPGAPGGFAGRGPDHADRPGGPNHPGGPGNFAGRWPDGDRRGYFRPGASGVDDHRPEGPGVRWGPNGPGDRGGPAWRDGGFGGPDRGWRNDRRYDWHGWRESHRDLFQGPRYRPPRGYGYGYRSFSPGYRLQPFFYDRAYWIDDPFAYRLPPAEGPYRWIRYYNDVVLVDLRTGSVVDVIRDFFF